MIAPEQISDEVARAFLDYVSCFGTVVMIDEEAALAWAKRQIADLAQRAQLPIDFEARAKMARELGL